MMEFSSMMSCLFRSAAAASVALLSTLGAAHAESNIPQLKGVWKGQFTGGFLVGDITHLEDPTKPLSMAGSDRQWIVTIDKQDGSGLSGTRTSVGSDKTEIILGVIRANGKTVLFSDHDTLFEAELISDTEMEVCAQESGDAIIATCELLRRQ